MGTQRAAVLGVGQTKYDTTYPGSMAGMLREAATNALEMSGKGWDDIDAVIMGKAPDFFEGVMMPEVYLAEALGCAVHRVGRFCGQKAWYRAASSQTFLPREAASFVCDRGAVAVLVPVLVIQLVLVLAHLLEIHLAPELEQ